ncbi:hypothetical protein [Amphritea sp.]|uniref:hypothetical protein n=1 Tax=Amphritea sp. TaxID=1872502 RepID=UPI003A90B4AB
MDRTLEQLPRAQGCAGAAMDRILEQFRERSARARLNRCIPQISTLKPRNEEPV